MMGEFEMVGIWWSLLINIVIFVFIGYLLLCFIESSFDIIDFGW